MATVLRPRYTDPFSPVLLSSEVLEVSQEQRDYIREILEISSSDSRFAEKAYQAIWRVLTGGSVTVPTVASLSPGSATIGDPSFTLHVSGTGFTPTSQIVWNGGVEPTVYVSATELTTEVDMTTATTATDIPVAVVNEGDVISNMTTFVIQAPVGTRGVSNKSVVVPTKSVAPVAKQVPAQPPVPEKKA